MTVLALICLALVALLAYREWASARERRDLYQRLQAPEVAVSSYAREQEPERKPLPTISLEDDARMKALREERERGDS